MILNKFKMKWAIAALLGLFLAGCAQTSRVLKEPVQASESVRASLATMGALFVQPTSPDVSQSRLVVYRAGQDNLPGATGVFVDGTYHASIVQGAWSQLCYQPGAVNLGARQIQVGVQVKNLFDSITAWDSLGGQTHYFHVVEHNGYPVFKPVSQVQALRDLAGAREQLHTISRVAQDCIQSAGVPLVAQVPDAPDARNAPSASSVSTALDKLTNLLLFDFDRSDLQAIGPAGLMALDKQLQQFRDGSAAIHAVRVIGHADPLGNPEINERLAMARAQTVRDHILRQLPQGVQVSMEGLSAKDPLVKHCENSLHVRTIACHAPNRRVVVVWSVSER